MMDPGTDFDGQYYTRNGRVRLRYSAAGCAEMTIEDLRARAARGAGCGCASWNCLDCRSREVWELMETEHKLGACKA